MRIAKVDGKAGMNTRALIGAYQQASKPARSTAGRRRRCSIICAPRRAGGNDARRCKGSDVPAEGRRGLGTQ